MSTENFKILLRHTHGQVTILEVDIEESTSRLFEGNILQDLILTKSLVIDLTEPGLFKIHRRNLLESNVDFHTEGIYPKSGRMSNRKRKTGRL